MGNIKFVIITRQHDVVRNGKRRVNRATNQRVVASINRIKCIHTAAADVGGVDNSAVTGNINAMRAWNRQRRDFA